MIIGVLELCDDKGMEHFDEKAMEHSDDVSWSFVITGVLEHCDDNCHGVL